jgi:hypothetical protein
VGGTSDGITWLLLGGEMDVDFAVRLKAEFGPSTWVAGWTEDVESLVIDQIRRQLPCNAGFYLLIRPMNLGGHPQPSKFNLICSSPPI